MKIENQITEKLLAEFAPTHLQVINESHMHNVPDGSESHFKVVVVSESFQGKRLLPRHKAINACLAEELKSDIHALAMHTYTAQEWQEVEDAPESPKCLGGSKLG